MKTWVITKFGGTSVKNRDCWNNIASIAHNHIKNGKTPVIVCSAPSQVSNKLEKLIISAINSNYHKPLQEIKNVYKTLAKELEIDFEKILGEDLSFLQNLCEGIALLQEASPKTRAKIMSLGELMLTKLGQNFLQQQKIETSWQNAKELLTSEAQGQDDNINYLAAVCSDEYDKDLDEKLDNLSTNAIITQGFIASNKNGETVLLGRGGSDTSAAYFAAKLNASGCEIWTDVSGMYTANPRAIPEARLLSKLNYAEAQEIASAGAKILHPNSINPVRKNAIPLYIKNLRHPEKEGTLITKESGDENALYVKSIITQHHVLLVSIDTINMWQKAGFLADIFNVFKKYAVSIDLISTSEGNVTVSLDTLAKPYSDKTLKMLLADLNKIANAKLIGPCASISFIGKNIKSVLHKISHLFEVFVSQKIYMLSQASNDLNLTFVVNEDQAERLAKKLHAVLIEQNPSVSYIGKSWLEEHSNIQRQKPKWWQEEKENLLKIAQKHAPIYVYYQKALEEAAANLKNCNQIEKIFYSIKANPNKDILQTFYDLKLNFECVSIDEVRHVLNLFPDINTKRILFTPNFAPKEEYIEALKIGVNLGVDNIYPLKNWAEIFANQDILIRIDPGYSEGHHKHVVTAHPLL